MGAGGEMKVASGLSLPRGDHGRRRGRPDRLALRPQSLAAALLSPGSLRSVVERELSKRPEKSRSSFIARAGPSRSPEWVFCQKVDLDNSQ